MLPTLSPTLRRHVRWLLPLVVLVVLGLWYLATQQWAIGRRAVAIADGTVRAWAAREVARLSDGGYQLTSSTIVVDEARRRIAIDTLILTTDTARNARRTMPLPYLALRLLGCGLEGVDLDRLTTGRGLHVQHFGCDSVSLLVDVPTELSQLARSRPAGSSRSFLNFRQRLDLPRTLPVILIDSIAFPQLGLVLSIAGATGHRTNITLDRLGMQFDSLRYDRRPTETEERVLLSRDVRVILEHFEGSQEAASHLGLRHLDISLARGTLRLDSLIWRPLQGAFTDSLGLTALEVGRLALDDVDWFGFLTSGDVRVGRFDLADALVRLPPQATAVADSSSDTPGHLTMAARLRALDRALQLDTLVARGLTFVQEGATSSDSTGVQVAEVQVTGLAVANTDSAWRAPFPIGSARLVTRGIVQRGAGERLLLDSLLADVPAGTLSAFGLRQGPEGDDLAFFRRHRYRRDRVAVAATRIDLVGMDLDTWLRDGVPRARRVTIDGLALDVLSDKRKALAPGRPPTRRTPQQWLADLPAPVTLDTITVTGAITYRERVVGGTAPGVLAFRDLRATITGFAPPGTGDSLLRLVAETRLMGAGRLQFTLELPRAAPDFRMRYRGTLGQMPAAALNPFLDQATGMRFDAGTIESIHFDATVTGGRARGQIAPRWRDLKVQLPGIARQGGFLGGLRRAVAGFAANTFAIRRDNHTAPDLRDGVIDYRWQASESLPSLLWASLREALLPVLKR